jgi:hypothetical protein
MLAHGIMRDVLAELILDGLASADAGPMLAGVGMRRLPGSRPPGGASLNDG